MVKTLCGHIPICQVFGGTCSKRPCAVVVFWHPQDIFAGCSSVDDAHVATRGGSGGGVGGYFPSLLLANKDDVLRWMIANKDDVLRWNDAHVATIRGFVPRPPMGLAEKIPPWILAYCERCQKGFCKPVAVSSCSTVAQECSARRGPPKVGDLCRE